MDQCKDFLLLLDSSDNEIVREGAFRAGEQRCASAVPKLAELLTRNHLGVQEAAESSLRKIGGKAVVQAVLPLLRSDEAPVRNLSMDILREVGHEDLQSLVKLLHDEDPDIRIFMADILGTSNNLLGVQALCDALLKDSEVNVRYQAAVSLGTLGFEEAAGCLNKAMEDDEWVQYAVIESLTKIKHNSSVEALVRALDKASDLVASMIIDALGEMGNVKAVTMLLKRMDNSATALRNKICKAVVNILGGKSLKLLTSEEREKFRLYLLVALEDEDVEVQDAAILGLSYVGGEKASTGIIKIAAALDPEMDQERLAECIDCLARIGISEALRVGLKAEDGRKAGVCVQALARFSEKGDEAAQKDAANILEDVFWGVEQAVQRQIIRVLANISTEEDKAFFVEVMERHPDATTVKGAVYFLGERMKFPDAADLIFPLLDHQYDDVKEAALEALIAIDGSDVHARFVDLFESDDPMHRLMATYALGRINPSENVEILRRALEDEIPDIRKVALESFAEVCLEADEWAKIIVPKLNDESRDVRLTLIELMGRCYCEEFAIRLQDALNDEDDWVRIRAIDALGQHKATEAVPKLVEMLDSPNRFVTMKAIEALGNIGGTMAFRSLLEISNSDDYELVRAAEDAIMIIQEEEENR